MRHLLSRAPASALAAAALLGLSACGGTDSPAGAKPASGVTVTDAAGTGVTVPAAPARVVALSEQDLDGALAIGVTPVGTVNGRGQATPPAYLKDRIAGITVVGDVAKPSVEKIIELRPDVILAGSVTDSQLLTQLREVAPTVVTYTPKEDWRTAFARLGQALNAEAKVTAALAAHDTKVAEAKSRLGAKVSTEISIVRWNPQGPGIMQRQHFASLVTAELGLSRPAGQQEDGFAHSAPLSLENLEKIDASYVFLGTLNTEGQDAYRKAASTPAYQQLDAVRAKRLVTVDGTVWTSRGGPLAAGAVIDDVVKALSSGQGGS